MHIFMMRGVVILMAMMVSMADSAEAQDSAEAAARTVVEAYVFGADEQDVDRVAGALHESVSLLVALPNGRLLAMTKGQYVAAIESKAVGGVSRSLSVESADPLGDDLFVMRTVILSETVRFQVVFTLLRAEDAWSILSSVTVVGAP